MFLMPFLFGPTARDGSKKRLGGDAKTQPVLCWKINVRKEVSWRDKLSPGIKREHNGTRDCVTVT